MMTFEEFKRAWCTDQAIDDEILWERGNRAADFGRKLARRYNEAFFEAFTGQAVTIPAEPQSAEIVERRKIASQYIAWENRIMTDRLPHMILAAMPCIGDGEC